MVKLKAGRTRTPSAGRGRDLSRRDQLMQKCTTDRHVRRSPSPPAPPLSPCCLSTPPARTIDVSPCQLPRRTPFLSLQSRRRRHRPYSRIFAGPEIFRRTMSRR